MSWLTVQNVNMLTCREIIESTSGNFSQCSIKRVFQPVRQGLIVCISIDF